MCHDLIFYVLVAQLRNACLTYTYTENSRHEGTKSMVLNLIKSQKKRFSIISTVTRTHDQSLFKKHLSFSAGPASFPTFFFNAESPDFKNGLKPVLFCSESYVTHSIGFVSISATEVEVGMNCSLTVVFITMSLRKW